MDAVTVPANLKEALRGMAETLPAIAVAAEFEAFVVARLDGGDVPAHLADMLVAFESVRGNPQALAVLERALHELPASLGRFRLSDTELRDLLQDLRLRLLVGSAAETEGAGAPSPRLLEYRGKGPLGAWLRASAVRLVLSNIRSRSRRREDELDAEEMLGSGAAAMVDGADAELRLAKQTYRGPFEEAFRTALAELTPRDRTVLRMYLLDGRNIDEIGAVFRVHRATIARWIADARVSLGKRTQTLMTANLDTNTAEFRSITRLCYSQIDVSLHTLLATQET